MEEEEGEALQVSRPQSPPLLLLLLLLLWASSFFMALSAYHGRYVNTRQSSDLPLLSPRLRTCVNADAKARGGTGYDREPHGAA